jgi:hypothetical protein
VAGVSDLSLGGNGSRSFIKPGNPLKCLAVSGCGKIQYYIDIVLKQGHSGGKDAVAQEVEFSYGKHALFQVEGQPLGEECMQVLLVLFLGFAVRRHHLKRKGRNIGQ